jgi:uncharacterized protein
MAIRDRLLVWTIDDTDGFDTAWVAIDGSRLTVDGRTVGQRPTAWWLEYRLETGEQFVHDRLVAASRWDGRTATLDLRRDAASGSWTADGEPRPDLDGALDCDLMACPLTNTMPVLRHDLHRTPGDRTLLMAFVEVPSLTVVPNRQRYTHLRPLPRGGGVVRYRSGTFSSDLTLDGDGFVVDYPRLGRRLAPSVN